MEICYQGINDFEFKSGIDKDIGLALKCLYITRLCDYRFEHSHHRRPHRNDAPTLFFQFDQMFDQL